MEFFKQNPGLRIVLIIISFIAAIVFVITGWKMTSEMTGLLIMIVGVAFLLVSLKIYNITFEDPKKKK